MRKTSSLALLLLLVGIMALTPVAHAKVTKIQFWHGLTGGEGPYLAALIEQFNKEHSNTIEVEVQAIPWDQLYDRLSRSMVTKRAPDLVLMNIRPRVPEYADRGTIMDMTPYLERLGIRRDDYLEVAWDAATWEGKQYAIPLDMYQAGLYYIVDDFIEVGLDPDSPPTERQAFLEYSRKLTKYDSKGELERSGFAVSSTWSRQFDILFTQFEGTWFTSDLKKARFNEQPGIDALQFLVDLIYEERVSAPGIRDTGETMRAGRASMRWDGVWAVNPSTDWGLNFRTSHIPTIGKRPGGYAGSHGFALPIQATEDPVQIDAALTFVSWITERSVDYAKAGQIPARKDVFFGPEFKELVHQSNIAQIWEYADYGANFPAADEALQQLTPAFEAAVMKVKPVRQALDDAAAHADKVLSR